VPWPGGSLPDGRLRAIPPMAVSNCGLIVVHLAGHLVEVRLRVGAPQARLPSGVAYRVAKKPCPLTPRSLDVSFPVSSESACPCDAFPEDRSS